MVANDLLANVELQKIKAERSMRDVLVPPADLSVAGFKTWYKSISAPEFERIHAQRVEKHSLVKRTEMLLSDALAEVGAKATDSGRCSRRLPSRYNEDLGFKLHEAVLRNIEAIQQDIETLEVRANDVRPACMQLHIVIETDDQPYAANAANLPISVRNPWPAGPAFIVVNDVMEFTDLQTLVSSYTKQLANLRRDLQPGLDAWKAVHKTVDILLTKQLDYRHSNDARLNRMVESLKLDPQNLTRRVPRS